MNAGVLAATFQRLAADKQPYGDVRYADPGYQADKVKRYPLNDEAHIRSAWSYINMPDNAEKYASGDVSKIKARIVSAWKAKIDPKGPPSAQGADDGFDLEDADVFSMQASPAELLPQLKRGKPIQLFHLGVNRTVDGRNVVATMEDLELVLQNLRARQNPVPLTWEHGEDLVLGDASAGECTSFVIQPDGLWAMAPAWTDEAINQIKSGERTWISPTFYAKTDPDGTIHPRVIRDVTLLSVPNIDGMQRVEVRARGAEGHGTHTPGPDGSSPSPATTHMSSGEPDRKGADMPLSKESLKLLGLAENASLEAIDNALVKVAMAAGLKKGAFPAGKGNGIQQCKACGEPLKCESCGAHAPMFVEPDDDDLNTGEGSSDGGGSAQLPAQPSNAGARRARVPFNADRFSDLILEKLAAKQAKEIEAAEKQKASDAVVEKAKAQGKLHRGNVEGFTALAALDPKQAESMLQTMAVVVPTRRTVSTTNPREIRMGTGATLAPSGIRDVKGKRPDEEYAAETEVLSMASQYAVKNGCSTKEALTRLRAQGAIN